MTPTLYFLVGSVFGAVIMWIGITLVDEMRVEPDILDSYAIVQMKKRLDSERGYITVKGVIILAAVSYLVYFIVRSLCK